MKRIDLTNQKFGKLTAIEIAEPFIKPSGKKVSAWWCECECGNRVRVRSEYLRSGHTTSCGCAAGRMDITGKVYGRLTVSHYVGDGRWECECECGNRVVVQTCNLNSGNTKSCGCLNSKGEAKIASILTEHGISFTKQFTFSDLIGVKGAHYAFDFAVLNKDAILYLIEYDGIQHYSSKHQFSKEESTLEIIQQRDREKNEYALSHNIPLIRIPYTQFDNLNIEDLQLQTTKFLLKKEGDE